MNCLYIKGVYSGTIIELFGCHVLFWVGLSSTEWFGMAFREFFLFFVAQKGIPSYFLLRGMVWNGIARICIYFGSTERNFELCSLRQNGSEQSYGSLFFLLHRMEFLVISSSAEGFGTEFRDFLLRRTTGIPSEITICSFYSVFCCLKVLLFFFHLCL